MKGYQPMRISSGLIVFFLVVTGCTTSSRVMGQPAAAATKDVMIYRVWQFLDDDWDYLQTAIPKAGEGGMNRIQLGQKITMDIHDLYKSSEKLELVRNCARLAHQLDLKVDLWTHELADVPDALKKNGKVVINDELWTWMKDKYARAFKLAPEIDGLVLTFAESQINIYSDKVITDMPEDARIAKLIDVMADICLEHNKTLFIRTFVYEPQELQFMRQAIASVANAVKDKGNVVVMTKCVPHDWTPFYPYNPLLGDVAGLPQIVEIDLGQEYTGLSKILHCEVNYIHAVMAHCRAKGVIGAVARVDRERGNRALGTPNEVNIHAFNRMVHDASLSVDAVWTEWADQRYGKAAAPYVIDALKATYDITNLTLYPLEQWIVRHSRLPDWYYTVSHISFVSPAKWIPSPRQELARDELWRPDWITLQKITSEKDMARALAKTSLDIIEQGRPHLSDADYKELKGYLELGRDLIDVFAGQNLAFCATVRYLNRQKGIGIERQSLNELRTEALGYIDQFAAGADLIEKRYGPQTYCDTPKLTRKYASEMRKLIENVS
ncbi:MAG: hypothetical protein JW709_08030 [Sedimentisphaerales bacterium]|nr:hypothetical protein [Sedimentisphaerales bacterium]